MNVHACPTCVCPDANYYNCCCCNRTRSTAAVRSTHSDADKILRVESIPIDLQLPFESRPHARSYLVTAVLSRGPHTQEGSASAGFARMPPASRLSTARRLDQQLLFQQLMPRFSPARSNEWARTQGYTATGTAVHTISVTIRRR